MKPLAIVGAVLLASSAAAAPAAGFEKVRSDDMGSQYADRTMKLLVDVPTGYLLVAPKKNDDAAYEFAFRHPTRRFEVRVALSALAESAARVKERAACAKTPGCVMAADLDAPSDAWGSTVLYNIGGGDAPFFPFPPEGVKKEFAADWGYVATAELEPGRTFNAEGYKLAKVVVIHRNRVGTVYRIVLADDVDTLQELDRPLFYGVRFEGAQPPGFPAKK